MVLPVPPDPLECTRLMLLAMPRVAAVVGSRVSKALQGEDVQIRLAGVGGNIGPNPGQHRPRVQVECWGRGGRGSSTGAPIDDGTAGRLARLVVADLPVDQVRVTTPAGDAAALVDVHADGAPFSSDDQSTGRPRWIVTLRLELFPLDV